MIDRQRCREGRAPGRQGSGRRRGRPGLPEGESRRSSGLLGIDPGASKMDEAKEKLGEAKEKLGDVGEKLGDVGEKVGGRIGRLLKRD